MSVPSLLKERTCLADPMVRNLYYIRKPSGGNFENTQQNTKLIPLAKITSEQRKIQNSNIFQPWIKFILVFFITSFS